MNRRDFLKVLGADQEPVEYMPIACLLRSGYGCAGYFNTSLNQALDEVVTLLNIRIVSLQKSGQNQVITDFNEFLEHIVQQYFKNDGETDHAMPEGYGKAIPMATIPYSEIAVLYPVSRIGQLMRHAQQARQSPKPMVQADVAIPKPKAQRQQPAKATTSQAKPAKPVTAKTAKAVQASSMPRKVISNSDATKHIEELPKFLDFDQRSVVLKALRTKLW